MKRKILVIGNWKLNHHRASAADFFAELKESVNKYQSVEMALAPVTPMLEFCGNKLAGCPVSLAAQNVFFEAKGAFTGEWSPGHLKELDVKYCIVGHSERRKKFFESNDDVAKKARACVDAKITPVCCVGESLAQRESGITKKIIEEQVLAITRAFGEEAPESLVFAYEPIWAIGTGNSASKEEAQDVHGFIRDLLSKSMGQKAADSMRILYGGSITPDNIREIVSMEDVDGALVGGASLQAATFLSMVKELSLGVA